MGGIFILFLKLIDYILFMENELGEINRKIVEMGYKSFNDAFSKFKDFNKFYDFVENCLKEGKLKVLNGKFNITDFEDFDIHSSLWENSKKIIMKQMTPKDVKFNMAIMFAYNLDNEIVKGTIKCDTFYFETIKKELIQKEMFEDIEKLNKILKQ